jgi:hypothetical protein
MRRQIECRPDLRRAMAMLVVLFAGAVIWPAISKAEAARCEVASAGTCWPARPCQPPLGGGMLSEQQGSDAVTIPQLAPTGQRALARLPLGGGMLSEQRGSGAVTSLVQLGELALREPYRAWQEKAP